MKKLFFVIIILFVTLSSNAQDIIIKKSGEEIKAKVIEMGVSEIKYKKFEFQDGPLYSISKADVVLVRYENGTNEVITTSEAPTPATPAPVAPTPATPTDVAPTPPASTKIEYNMGNYYQGGRYISKYRVISILRSVNDPKINAMLKKSTATKTIGNLLAAPLGIPLVVVGSMVTLGGVAMTNNDDPDAGGYITVGGIMVGTGFTFMMTNIGFQAKSKKHLLAAIELYNANYGK